MAKIPKVPPRKSCWWEGKIPNPYSRDVPQFRERGGMDFSQRFLRLLSTQGNESVLLEKLKGNDSVSFSAPSVNRLLKRCRSANRGLMCVLAIATDWRLLAEKGGFCPNNT
ncbi:hypothetical protein CEXT_447781 [Caerostris extrusa]|uniref:Uncharacterized protein n=1 Tax=Caerostris extrusa TaxID=172846 RepID=A0AAV4V906_CAEEX|nr:hypothetical protein CEXT_447781 [Caerostris extrusa]